VEFASLFVSPNTRPNLSAALGSFESGEVRSVKLEAGGRDADCVDCVGLTSWLAHTGWLDRCLPSASYKSYLVDPASSHMLVSKIKPCMSKYKLLYTVKLRTAHYISYSLFDGPFLHGYP
jgi:hypothetical protein